MAVRLHRARRGKHRQLRQVRLRFSAQCHRAGQEPAADAAALKLRLDKEHRNVGKIPQFQHADHLVLPFGNDGGTAVTLPGCDRLRQNVGEKGLTPIRLVTGPDGILETGQRHPADAGRILRPVNSKTRPSANAR